MEVEGDEALVRFHPAAYRIPAAYLADAQHASQWRKMKNMRQLQRGDLLNILKACGFQHGSPDEDDVEGDPVLLEKPNGAMLLDSSIHVGWEFMKWALQLTGEEVQQIEFVDVSLLESYMRCLKTGWQGEEGEEKEAFLQQQNKRKEVLKMKLQAEKVVVLPVQHSGHYFNLAIEGRYGEAKRTVEYRDSLGRKSAAAPVMKEYVEMLAASLDLEWLAVDMQRVNAALQPPASSVCGCFLLHWVEQIVRSMILHEAWCSAGWPEAGAWADRIYKLTVALKKEQEKRLSEAADCRESCEGNAEEADFRQQESSYEEA